MLAVIDSRELADAKAGYLAAGERLALAESTFTREKSLWEKKISAEQDYLAAKQALTEARIELQAAKHKLQALGLSEPSLKQPWLAQKGHSRAMRFSRPWQAPLSRNTSPPASSSKTTLRRLSWRTSAPCGSPSRCPQRRSLW